MRSSPGDAGAGAGAEAAGLGGEGAGLSSSSGEQFQPMASLGEWPASLRSRTVVLLPLLSLLLPLLLPLQSLAQGSRARHLPLRAWPRLLQKRASRWGRAALLLSASRCSSCSAETGARACTEALEAGHQCREEGGGGGGGGEAEAEVEAEQLRGHRSLSSARGTWGAVARKEAAERRLRLRRLGTRAPQWGREPAPASQLCCSSSE